MVTVQNIGENGCRMLVCLRLGLEKQKKKGERNTQTVVH